MDTYSFGKRKRELGGGVDMMASSPPNERYDSPYQPRKTPAHQYSPTHKCSDDSDDRGSEADVSCRIVDTSGSLHNSNSKVALAVSQHDVPSSDGESGLSFISNSASQYTSDYDTGAETSSCASTAAFIDDEEEEEYDNTVRATEDHKPKARTFPSSSVPSQLLGLGPDIMVSLVRFLEPAETLRLMTMPLCKEWRRSYTAHQDTWKTLCCEDPFSAKLNKKTLSAGCVSSVSSEDDSCFDDDTDDDSFCALGEDELTGVDAETNDDVLGEYRLLYTSFVRCMKYLEHIKEEAQNGRPPSVIEHGPDKYNRFPTFGVTKSLKKFLAKKKHISLRSVIGDGSGSFQSNPPTITPVSPIEVLADGTQVQQTASDQTAIEIKTAAPTSDFAKPKYGKSMITDRLLGPTSGGTPSYLNLPTSCAIYSIVNWLVAHPDVEGIQTMCICALPILLEDEQQRMTAQRVGIVEVILCGMLRFPKNAKLHTEAFHTMVLLARPIGGREGMLFDNSMADSTRSLGLASKARYGRIASSRDVVSSPEQQVRSSLNGVSIFIASMERFASHEELQAMACWAMVNLALVPAQKAMLLGMNAIPAVVNAMTNHPKSYPTQFRALFALINLCVPNRNTLPTPSSGAPLRVNEQTEKDILDVWAPSIAGMVVRAMENFCSSATILNRACLVLHNLSQTPDYIPVLLWTPHCYQMLEWCRANHSTDTVLLRSASSTLARIQAYLSQNQDEQQKFVQSLQREKQEQR